jgi:hypothetical protein
MMEAWKAARTRASFIGRSSVARTGFVSALPSPYDGPACCARGKEISRNRPMPLEGGEGFGGMIDYAVSGALALRAIARRYELKPEREPLATWLGRRQAVAARSDGVVGFGSARG